MALKLNGNDERLRRADFVAVAKPLADPKPMDASGGHEKSQVGDGISATSWLNSHEEKRAPQGALSSSTSVVQVSGCFP